MRPKLETGEWQPDPESGLLCRKVGNTIEYETVYNINGFSVPQSQLADFNKRMKEADEKYKEEQREAMQKPPMPLCPFRYAMTDACKGPQCALYADGCTLARMFKGKAGRDTKGLKCPVCVCDGVCREDCVLFDGGCKITSIESEES